MVHGNIRTWSSTPGVQGLERVFEYLARTDLAALPLGRTDIEGDDVYVLLSEADTKPPEQVQFEAHRRYIDIQLVVRGQESIGVTPLAGLVTTEPYDAARDIEFFAVPQQSETVALRSGRLRGLHAGRRAPAQPAPRRPARLAQGGRQGERGLPGASAGRASARVIQHLAVREEAGAERP